MNRHLTASLLFLLLTLFSCQSRQADERPTTDSIASALPQEWSIALLPTTDCLPFYLAAQGIYDSLGLPLKAVVYASQMDAEQAVVEGKCIGCATDLFRTAVLQKQKKPLRYCFTTPREWNLIANKRLRLRSIKQLNDRVVAITRHSCVHYLCEQAASRMKPTDLMLRPQINDIFLRTKMLVNAQVDVAILPQPQALMARKQGHTLLPLDGPKEALPAGFALSAAFTNRPDGAEKVALLMKGYNLAIERLKLMKKLPADCVREFRLGTFADSIDTAHAFAQAALPTAEQQKTAVEWLKGQEALPKTFDADTLTFPFHP